ncbi:NDP-sugar synthase [Roseovarius aestuarii]|nr:NDP-sugar synthase [Roseovarius aestuarii]
MIGIILAGGKSLRFGGTGFKPKPVVQVNGIAMVLRAAAKLIDEGASRILVLTGQNHHMVRDALGMTDDKGFLATAPAVYTPFELRFSGDDTGSGGRLLAINRSEMAGGALLSYSDVFTDAPLGPLIDIVRNGTSTLALMTVSPRLPWGIVHSENGRVTRFNEKPQMPTIRTNAGFYACSPSILDYVHEEREMLEQEPMARMIETKSVSSSHHDGEWIGLDSPKDVMEAELGPKHLFRNSSNSIRLTKSIF